MSSWLTYKESGVDYAAMDPFKRLCQQAAVTTAGNLARFGLEEVRASRGESAFLVEFPQFFLAHVEEGLGTKNLVADAMPASTGKTYYDQVAQCNAAMAFNDLITLGALPISFALHLAVADGAWFNNQQRCCDVASGCVKACNLAGATWGGGETSTLKDIIIPGAAEMNCSAVGLIKPKRRLIDPANIAAGDRIVLLGSSGIHANGLTSAREIAQKLPDGFATKLPDGTMYGEALLTPTIIYVEMIETLQKDHVQIHYAINITGHGWRKLMRAPQPFAYIIEDVPQPQPVFDFIQEYGPVDDKEAYGNFNMGAGFALIVAPKDAHKVILAGIKCGIRVEGLGYVAKSKRKKVVIKPKKITFVEETLQIR